jgi:hypothetical protein
LSAPSKAPEKVLNFRSVVAYSGLLAIGAVYGLNVFSPMRLNTDAGILLSMALSAAAGHGYLVNAHSAVFPPGYPWMISLLYVQGWASPASLMLLDLLWLCLGIFSLAILYRDAFGFSKPVSLLLCALVLLNWVLIKHAALPQTDIPFFGAVMFALMLGERGRAVRSERLAIVFLVCAWLVCLAAIGIRRPGVALLPALAWAIATRPGWLKHYAAAGIWQKIAALAAVLAAALVSLVWISKMSNLYGSATPRSIMDAVGLALKTTGFRLTEVGEMVLNFPSAKLPVSVLPLVAFSGCAGLCIATCGAILRAKLGVIEIFCLSYMAILFVWPYTDSRFLIPVLPFIIGYGFLVAQHIGRHVGRWKTTLAALAIAPYLLTGAIALSYNARISVSAGDFPNLYGDGNLRPTYCHHLKSCPVDDPGRIDQHALGLLQAFSR